MHRSPTRAKFKWTDLGDIRHVSALVDNDAAGVALVAPFVGEGLAAGWPIVQVGAAATGEALRERLRADGIDVAHQMSVGRLVIRTAPDHLAGPSFDPKARVAFLRSLLGAGVALGDRGTRLILDMAWSADAVTPRALLAYETTLGQLLDARGDVAVCMYDLNRHSARTIADVLGSHPAALVGGVLRTMRGPARESARERLLSAASLLFQQAGIQATGVDAVIAEAGVAKATFYRHFPSKDDLVIAWLRDPRTWWLDQVRADIEAHSTGPTDAIPVFFEALGRWLESENYRGCPYLNTAVEITDVSHPGRIAVTDFLQTVEDFLTEAVAAAGYRDPRSIAMRLQALAAGSISLSVARGNSRATLAARDAALGILAGAERA